MNYQKIIKDIEIQLKEYLGNKKAVIGISGGIDSTVVAALAVRAIGKQNVWGISMPYKNQDTSDAQLVIDNLEINSREINIGKVVDNNIRKLEQVLDKEIDKITKGNLMARERMKLLYGVANSIDGMVIGTGNKSEIEIGYFTKYGDGGVDIEPIGNIYKTEVYEIANLLALPKQIINKKPSAGLWQGQTDEDELGITYQQIDDVLKQKINNGEIYDKVQKLRKGSEHKKNIPPIFKIRR